MEMNMAKFSEKLSGLLEVAKKKKNVLEYQEINDYFKDVQLSPDDMEKVFDYLEANGIDVHFVLMKKTPKLCFLPMMMKPTWKMKKKLMWKTLT